MINTNNLLTGVKILARLAIENDLIVEFFPAGHEHNPYHNQHTIGYGFGKGSEEFDTLEEVLDTLTTMIYEDNDTIEISEYLDTLKRAVKISKNLTNDEFAEIMKGVPQVPDTPTHVKCGSHIAFELTD